MNVKLKKSITLVIGCLVIILVLLSIGFSIASMKDYYNYHKYHDKYGLLVCNTTRDKCISYTTNKNNLDIFINNNNIKINNIIN